MLQFDACYTPNQGETATKYKEVFFKNVTDQKGFNYQKYYTETGFIYRDIEYDNNLLLNGSFQSHKYFHHNFEKIIEIITIPDSYKNKVYDVFGDLLMSDKPLVSVHIRRGDYLSKPDYHYNLPKEYYNRSIENLKDCNFIFISDDMNWVKENFNGNNFFFSESQDEIFDFLNGLPSDEFNKIQEYFKNIPLLYKDMKFTCNSCNTPNNIRVDSLNNFF